MEEIRAPKRLNLVLDNVSFCKLEKIKEKNGDATFTQAVKRTIAFLEFIDQKKAEGAELYLSDGSSKKLQEVVLV
jgi:hypothetical protein